MIEFFFSWFKNFKDLFPFAIIIVAIVIAKLITANPVIGSIIWLNNWLSAVPKVVSIILSKVSIDTEPAIKEIIFADV